MIAAFSISPGLSDALASGIRTRRGGAIVSRVRALLLAVGVLLAGCGGGSGDITPDATPAGTLEVSSDAFDDGGAIPPRFTCDGEDTVPPVTWSGLPDGTEQVAVTLTDPDAPGGTFVHWLTVFPPEDGTDAAPTVEGRNGFDATGYGGPCPPEGDEPHRYVFTVYASGADLDLKPGFSASELADALEADLLARGLLTGTFGR